jgi:hypothetical protein
MLMTAKAAQIVPPRAIRLFPSQGIPLLTRSPKNRDKASWNDWVVVTLRIIVKVVAVAACQSRRIRSHLRSLLPPLPKITIKKKSEKVEVGRTETVSVIVNVTERKEARGKGGVRGRGREIKIERRAVEMRGRSRRKSRKKTVKREIRMIGKRRRRRIEKRMVRRKEIEVVIDVKGGVVLRG